MIDGTKTTNSVQYGVLHIETDTLMCLEKSSNGGSDFCNEYTQWLTTDDYLNIPWLTTEENVDNILKEDYSMPWYSSSEDRPRHLQDVKDYVKVKVSRIETIEKIN